MQSGQKQNVQKKDISVGTGGTGGVYQIVGTAIANLINEKLPNARAVPEPAPALTQTARFLAKAATSEEIIPIVNSPLALLVPGGEATCRWEIILALTTTVLGIMALAAGSQGFIRAPLVVIERVLMVIAAVLLIYPGLKTDLAGIFLAALVLFHHYRRFPGRDIRIPSGAAGGERDELGKFKTGEALDDSLSPVLKAKKSF